MKWLTDRDEPGSVRDEPGRESVEHVSEFEERKSRGTRISSTACWMRSRRTKNRDCKVPGGSPHFWSDTVNLKGTASANSFAASQLIFSRQQRI